MELQSCDRAPRDALEAPLAVGVETLHCPTPLAGDGSGGAEV